MCGPHRKLTTSVQRIRRYQQRANSQSIKDQLGRLIQDLKDHFQANDGELFPFALPRESPKRPFDEISPSTPILQPQLGAFVPDAEYTAFLPLLDPAIPVFMQIANFNMLFSVQERAEFLIASKNADIASKNADIAIRVAEAALLSAETAMINASSECYQETQRSQAESKLKEIEVAAILNLEEQKSQVQIRLKEIEFAASVRSQYFTLQLKLLNHTGDCVSSVPPQSSLDSRSVGGNKFSRMIKLLQPELIAREFPHGAATSKPCPTCPTGTMTIFCMKFFADPNVNFSTLSIDDVSACCLGCDTNDMIMFEFQMEKNRGESWLFHNGNTVTAICNGCRLESRPIHVGENWNLAHDVSASIGGSNHVSNVCVAHPECNLSQNTFTFRKYWAAQGMDVEQNLKETKGKQMKSTSAAKSLCKRLRSQSRIPPC